MYVYIFRNLVKKPEISNILFSNDNKRRRKKKRTKEKKKKEIYLLLQYSCYYYSIHIIYIFITLSTTIHKIKSTIHFIFTIHPPPLSQ